MDYGYQHPDGQYDEDEHAGQFDGDDDPELDEPHHHHQQAQYEQEGEDEDYYNEQDDGPSDAGETKKKTLASGRDPSAASAAGKLFVGGLSWETSEDTFANYFSKFGEITDSVIMTDRHSGRPRGFGFVTFSDVAVADRVLEQDHVIDGRSVEVKRTVPREDMSGKGVKRTKKIFIGGITPSFTEDELKEYFSVYGAILDHQIMLDHKTGRSRGFGFVTFESEEAVERIFNEGKTHELGGKRVEIKRAEPKRAGGDYGGSSKSQSLYGGSASGYGGGSLSRYGGKMGNEYGGYNGYGAYGGYGSYGGSFGGGSGGFYGGYGGGGGYGYGFGFGGPMMYGSMTGGGYGGSFGSPGGYGRSSGGFGGGKAYGRNDSGSYGGGKSYSNGGSVGGGKGYGGGSGGSGSNPARFHPYRK